MEDSEGLAVLPALVVHHSGVVHHQHPLGTLAVPLLPPHHPVKVAQGLLGVKPRQQVGQVLLEQDVALINGECSLRELHRLLGLPKGLVQHREAHQDLQVSVVGLLDGLQSLHRRGDLPPPNVDTRHPPRGEGVLWVLISRVPEQSQRLLLLVSQVAHHPQIIVGLRLDRGLEGLGVKHGPAQPGHRSVVPPVVQLLARGRQHKGQVRVQLKGLHQHLKSGLDLLRLQGEDPEGAQAGLGLRRRGIQLGDPPIAALRHVVPLLLKVASGHRKPDVVRAPVRTQRGHDLAVMLEGLGELALAEAAVRRPEPTAAVQKAAVGLGDGLVEGPLRGAVPSLRELDLADRDPLLRDLVARVDRGRPREVGLRSEYGRAPLLLGLRPQPLFQLSLREGTEGLHSLHFARLAVVLPHVVARELLQHDHVLLVHALVVVDPRGVDPETQRSFLGFEKIHHKLSVLHVRPG